MFITCSYCKCYVRACDDFASAYQCRMQLIKLPDESATLALGQHLIAQLSAGSVVALTGGLGAGKTTLVRGMLRAVLGDIEVPSPTFTLVQTYELPDYEIWHCDMYRLERPEDGYELGLLDAFEDAVCLIEWPDKIAPLLPKNVLEVDIGFDGEGRVAKLTGFGDIDFG